MIKEDFMSKKPDAFIRRFIEWSWFHGCPIMVEQNKDEWVLFKGNKLNWKLYNYKIDNKSHEIYYSKLYVHGMN